MTSRINILLRNSGILLFFKYCSIVVGLLGDIVIMRFRTTVFLGQDLPVGARSCKHGEPLGPQKAGRVLTNCK